MSMLARTISLFTTIAAVIAVCTAPLGAQATVRGQVVAAPGRTPLVGASVSLARGGARATTDSAGSFALTGIPHGRHQLVAAAPGFRPETTEVELDVDVLETAAIVLQRAVQTLAGVSVTGEASTITGRISGFEERRRFGNGTFIDRSMLDRFANRQLSEALQALAPGVSIRRGSTRKAWAATARTPWTSAGVFGQAGTFALDEMDKRAGAKPACYMDVYLNGALVYNSKGHGAPLFDLNSLAPDNIESVEAYASAAQVPAQFNRSSGGCGVLVIWLR